MTANRRFWHLGIAILWAAIPAIYYQYQSVWDRLPVRMATHFDIHNHANGWAPRESSMYFILGLTASVVLLGTFVLARIRKPDAASWGVLAMFYIVLAVLYRASGAVIEYNLSGNFFDIAWPMRILVVAVVAIIILSVMPKGNPPLAHGDLVAEETHASPKLALVFGAAALAEMIAAYTLPIPLARLGLLIASGLFIAITAMTASGFHYQFRRTGLEIRTLGFRLRSIPLSQILEYTIESWNPLRGYGIRCMGSTRAYVWGSRVVRIKTSDGEIFLGHNNPERIVHDLDAMKQFSH
jgi:hypothetical protein